MKDVLLIGKPNEPFKDLHLFLSRIFRVQVSVPDINVLSGILKIVKPDIVVLSLVGIFDFDQRIYRTISDVCRQTPIITIGTEAERKGFLKYYEGRDFENLIRPVNNISVLNAIIKKLHLEDVIYPDMNTESSKKKVLVIDDNGTTLRTVKMMLDSRYNVYLATSGSRALATMGKIKPDVILLDYEMPICDGRQTLEMIRTDEELCDIPVIFLTAISDRKHIEAVLGLNVSGYLLKPSSEEEIVSEIEKALRGHVETGAGILNGG